MRDVGRVDKRPCRPSVVLLEGRTAQSAPRPTVGGPQHYSRLTTIADYLAFVATAVTQHNASAHDAVQIERMVGLIRKHRPSGLSRGFDGDPHTKSPPSDLIERFMDVVAVDHPDNPFRDPGIHPLPYLSVRSLHTGPYRKCASLAGRRLMLHQSYFKPATMRQDWNVTDLTYRRSKQQSPVKCGVRFRSAARNHPRRV